MKVIAAGVLLLACCAGPTAAEADPRPLAARGVALSVDGDRVSLALPDGPLPTDAFLALAQELTGRVFTYRPEELAETSGVSFLGTVTLHRDGFFDFTRTMLRLQGLDCLERGTGDAAYVEVVRMEGHAGFADTDGDGLPDRAVPAGFVDTDGDGLPDTRVIRRD